MSLGTETEIGPWPAVINDQACGQKFLDSWGKVVSLYKIVHTKHPIIYSPD